MKGVSQRGAQLTYGAYGLKSLDSKWITARQIEAARIAATRYMKREGQMWIRIFPDKPITKKPAETRMGKGKGSPELWVAPVKPGRMLYEMDGVEQDVAAEAFRLASRRGTMGADGKSSSVWSAEEDAELARLQVRPPSRRL